MSARRIELVVRARLSLAVAATSAALVAGCGGGGNEASRRPTPRPVEPTTSRPATAPTVAPIDVPDAVVDGPAPDEPVVDVEIPTTTQPAGEPSATRPATQPAALVPDEPSNFGDLADLGEGTDASQAIAANLAQLASGTLLSPNLTPAAARQAEAVLTTAVRLAPSDERLARRLVEARLAVSGVEPAIEALDHYRSLAPDDRLAQIRYVDLSAETLPSVGERLDYFRRLADAESVPAEVRAHAATSAAALLQERLEDADADAMVRRAVELDPYNPRAVELDYYRRLTAGADRPTRVEGLAAMLRANVVQPDVLSATASELAAAGLVDESQTFFDAATRAYAATGRPPSPGHLSGQVSALLIDRRPQAAAPLLGGLLDTALAGDPTAGGLPRLADDIAGGITLVSLAGKQGNQASLAEVRRLYTSGVNGVLASFVADDGRSPEAIRQSVVDAFNPEAGEERPLPDLTALLADVERLRREEPGVRAGDFTLRLLGLRAWLDLYFGEEPTDPAILDAIRQLAGEGSTLPARYAGWQALRQNNLAEAREKLSAVADADPLARLGLLLVRKADDEDVTADATELLRQHPSGPIGATIADAFAQDGVRLTADPAEAEAVRRALSLFPQRLLDLIDPARARNFYSLTARPERVGHEYGEPLIAVVELRNAGGDVLTIGPGGVIGPDLRIDAQVRGIIQERLPGSATATWAGRTRLEPGERLEQRVRVDGPQLGALLAANPHLSLTVFAEAVTNPATTLVPDPSPDAAEGAMTRAYAVSAAGQSTPFARVMDRRGLPLDLNDPGIRAGLEQRVAQLRDGAPLEKVRAADATAAQIRWLAGHVGRLQEQGAAADRIDGWRRLAAQLQDSLTRAAQVLRVDAPGDEGLAAAYVRFTAAQSSPADARLPLLQPLSAASDPAVRSLALLAYASLVPDAAATATLAGDLAENDPDPTVRRLASATSRLATSD